MISLAWAAGLRERRLLPSLERTRAFYARRWSGQQVAAWQLERFNRLWAGVSSRVPHWSELDLPASFESWEQFQDCVPPMERRLIQERQPALLHPEVGTRSRRSTGGSTGEPLQIPVGRAELEVASSNLWFGRGLAGLRPSEPAFLLWGHSHLLDSGWRGSVAGWGREAADQLLGYRRWSAYDLSRPALRRAGEEVLRFRPRYLLGYSVALDRLARANDDRRDDFRDLSLTAVVATAEGFPGPGSARRISRLFGCPVWMEYGAVETGPLAYGRWGQPYQVFWKDFHLESVPAQGMAGGCELLVTALSERCLPLIRYRIGDLVEDSERGGSLRELGRVIGRCNDWVCLPDGTRVHSEAFAHALKTSRLEAFQVRQEASGRLRISYRGAELDEAMRSEIGRRLERIHPGLAGVPLERVAALETSVAGKARPVIREAE